MNSYMILKANLKTILSYAKYGNYQSRDLSKHEKILMEHLNKEKPERAIPIEIFSHGTIIGESLGCPLCTSDLIHNNIFKPEQIRLDCCGTCGQRIDWSVQL